MSTQPSYEPAPPAPTPATARAGTMGSIAARVLLTLLGAAGMIVGAFLEWLPRVDGTKIPDKALISTNALQTTSFVASVGFVMIVLGLIAIVGLAPRTGVLTSLAGALGIVALVLFVITLYRLPGDFGVGTLRVGAWVCLAGSVLALVGGFLGARPRVVRVESVGPTTVVDR
jgi:uncharacterized Tic20 family protein